MDYNWLFDIPNQKSSDLIGLNRQQIKVTLICETLQCGECCCFKGKCIYYYKYLLEILNQKSKYN